MSLFGKNSIFKKMRIIEKRIDDLTKKYLMLEEQIYQKEFIRKSQLLRIRNNDEISNDFIIKDLEYLDLSPEKAFRLYNDNNLDFVLVDVSREEYNSPFSLPEAVKIPLEDLWADASQIKGYGKTIFVISEDGVRSINACKILAQMGFCNLNNISGGYQFWPQEHPNVQHINKNQSEDENAFEDNVNSDLAEETEKDMDFGEDDFLKEA